MLQAWRLREKAYAKRWAQASCHKGLKITVILTRLSLLKNYLTPAANKQELSSYQTGFFHFWQNTNFSPTFAVC